MIGRHKARPSRPIYDEDNLAERLLDMAYVARTMAPAWKVGWMETAITGPDGGRIGAVIPGRGIYIDHDLKRFGITKRVPGVYESSPMRRFFDRVNYDEIGAITTYDGIINGRANGKADDIFISKSTITTAVGFWYDTFRAGGTPAAGVYDSATAPTDQSTDRSTVGAFSNFFTNPTGSDKKYLIGMGWGATSAHNFAILVDQHTQGGSFRTGVSTAETVASPETTVRQYGPGTNGTGNQISTTVTTVRGTPTATNSTMTYLDEAGGASSAVNLMAATADPVDRCLALPNVGSPFAVLASGDLGVRQVSAHTKAATADASGAFAITIVTPLAFVPGLVTNTYIERDAPMNVDGLTELANSSLVIGCLKVLVFANATSLGTMIVTLKSVAG